MQSSLNVLPDALWRLGGLTSGILGLANGKLWVQIIHIFSDNSYKCSLKNLGGTKVTQKKTDYTCEKSCAKYIGGNKLITSILGLAIV